MFYDEQTQINKDDTTIVKMKFLDLCLFFLKWYSLLKQCAFLRMWNNTERETKKVNYLLVTKELWGTQIYCVPI